MPFSTGTLQTTLNDAIPRRESMNVEYTGRQFEITPVTRKQVETGLEKLQKILGTFETHVILSAEKHRHIAEIAITVRNHPPIVSVAEAAEMTVAVGGDPATAVPVKVHSFPNTVRYTETHVVKSADSVSFKPLTLEEAVKEAEFRDREVFVFRDPQGRVKVLHRKKDGKLEVIEAP